MAVHFTKWTSTGLNGTSKTVSLALYASPADSVPTNTMGTVWTLINVPLSAFVSSSWDLSGVETMYFNTDSQSRTCVIDNVYFYKKGASAAPTRQPTVASTRIAATITIDEIGLKTVLGVQPLYDGEPNSFAPTTIHYAESLPNIGLRGSYGLQLEPDTWHQPQFLLMDPAYRSDLQVYDEMVLYAKCEHPNTPLTIHFGRWTSTGIGGTSASVYVGNYAEPRDNPVTDVIGTEWTLVRIPLTRFVTKDWDLAGAEWVVFNVDSQSRQCVIDNVYLRENKGPVVVGVEMVTSTVIRVQTNKYFDLSSARTLSNYVVTMQGTTSCMSPVSIGLVYRFQNFKPDSFVGKSNYYIYLSFSSSDSSSLLTCRGADTGVDLIVANVTDPAGNDMNRTVLRIPCQVQPTTAIKVNQLGYLPNRPKLAYVGDYFGDLGGGVWAVGSKASIWSWSRVAGVFTKVSASALPSAVAGLSFYAVAANSEADVWVVGQRGVILHYDGVAWTSITSPTTHDLRAIDFGPTRQGVIVGDGGTILTFVASTAGDSGGSWVVDSSYDGTVNLRCAWVGFSSVYVGGDGGLIMYKTPKNLFTSSSTTSWYTASVATTQPILSFAGVRATSDVYAALAGNGVNLLNQWGTWKLNTPTGAQIKAWALYPTYQYEGVAVGSGGLGMNLQTPIWTRYKTNSTADLTTIALLEERTMFAFGVNGTCLRSNPQTNDTWTHCFLPDSASVTVYGSAAVMEGPLRIPFPRPAVYLEQYDHAASAWSVVGTYSLRLEALNFVLSGEDLFSVDFTSASTKGLHRLRIPNIGTSYTFNISTHALDDAAYNTCRVLYYQRSGTALVQPYSDPLFVRGIDHEFNTSASGRRIDGAYHWSVGKSPLSFNETVCPLHTTCPAASLRDGAGGWFDAGDYSKYVSTGTAAVWKLLTMVDIFNAHNFPLSDNFNIPESGDGVPDVLNEATWEINWLLKMQRLEDGGVHNKLASEVWEDGMPQYSDLGGEPVRFFMARTTMDTATVGATFAIASRLWAPYNASFAALLLNRAKLAWSFLQKYPTNTPAGGFVNPSGHISGQYYDADDADNRAWIAAELYRTTCQLSYGQKYVDYVVSNNNVIGMLSNDFVDYGLEAAWAFYYSSSSCSGKVTEPTSFATTRAVVYSTISTVISTFQQQTLNNPYRNLGRMDVPIWIGWGSFGLNQNNMMGVLGWHMTGDTSHLDWMSLSLDTSMGANPLNMAFTSGVGQNTPKFPLQGQSKYDGLSTPIPGYGVFGPFCHVSASSINFLVAQSDANNYPSLVQPTSPFPILRRWADSNLLPEYNEGGIGPATFQCMVYQTLAATATNSISTASTEPPVPTATPTKAPTARPTTAPHSRRLESVGDVVAQADILILIWSFVPRQWNVVKTVCLGVTGLLVLWALYKDSLGLVEKPAKVIASPCDGLSV